eukprot:9116690-Pyramimonas_sp.AAC.1
MVAAQNCVYGSTLSPPRLAQIVGAVTEHIKSNSVDSDTLFQLYLPLMKEQLSVGSFVLGMMLPICNSWHPSFPFSASPDSTANCCLVLACSGTLIPLPTPARFGGSADLAVSIGCGAASPLVRAAGQFALAVLASFRPSTSLDMAVLCLRPCFLP